jgi:AcrR family transcriptional regulator
MDSPGTYPFLEYAVGMTAASSIETQSSGAPGRRRADQLPGGRHGLTREEVAESQRDRLLKAMTITVGRRGYRDAHITEVVDRAGVSRRTFYEHFEGKEECFAAAYGQAVGKLVELTVSAAAAEDDWADSLRAGLGVMLSELAAHPEAARVCFLEVLAAGPQAVGSRDEAMRGFLPLFENAPTEVPRTMRIFESLGMGRVADLSDVLHREIAAGRVEELPALLAELMYMMVLPFMGPEAAALELARGAEREAAA